MVDRTDRELTAAEAQDALSEAVSPVVTKRTRKSAPLVRYALGVIVPLNELLPENDADRLQERVEEALADAGLKVERGSFCVREMKP